jgi:hypothetical protein
MDTLSQLAEIYKTDKGMWHHGYTPIYNMYFESLKDKQITLLEIGIGGYEYVNKGGESLKMWRDYFSNANIIGFDFYKKELNIKGVSIYQGSQIDNDFLKSLPAPFDIIIDDGSHVSSHIISTFDTLFCKLNSGGIYVVEDTETSYWSEHYGGGTLPTDTTSMNFFKGLCDTLNPEYGVEDIYGIKTIHFYNGLIFIFKK